MTRSVPQALRPAPEGAAIDENGPAPTLKPAVMISHAGDESRQAPSFRLHEQDSDPRLFSGCGFLLWRSRWPLARHPA